MQEVSILFNDRSILFLWPILIYKYWPKKNNFHHCGCVAPSSDPVLPGRKL